MKNSNRVTQNAHEGYWLYTDLTSDNCIFTKSIMRDINTAPWVECTNEEKEKWEREHQPEP